MLRISFFVLFFAVTGLHAQVQLNAAGDTLVYDFVEQMPVFPGGEKAMDDYFFDQIQYPYLAIQNCVEGRVFLKCIIKSDGSVGEVTIDRGLGAGCEYEAKRVAEKMPAWSPGIDRGNPVNVRVTIPVVFELDRHCKPLKKK